MFSSCKGENCVDVVESQINPLNLKCFNEFNECKTQNKKQNTKINCKERFKICNGVSHNQQLQREKNKATEKKKDEEEANAIVEGLQQLQAKRLPRAPTHTPYSGVVGGKSKRKSKRTKKTTKRRKQTKRRRR